MTFGMTASEYRLTDLLSSAGATIGVIIAGTILLQFLSTKYTDLSERYRDLAGEYRGVPSKTGRHDPLRSQIRTYHWRLVLLNWASSIGAVALLSFLLAVQAGGLSLLFPPVRAFKAIGTAGLFLGLLLISGAVALELVESVMSRSEIGAEVADLDEEARTPMRWPRNRRISS